MELNKEELIKFGKRLRTWGCIIPSDILDCAADEHLQEDVEREICLREGCNSTAKQNYRLCQKHLREAHNEGFDDSNK